MQNNKKQKNIANLFPCDFSIKAIGKKENLKDIVCNIITRHIGNISPSNIKKRPSKNNNYLSVSVKINAKSKTQLDAIYAELNNHSSILYTL